MTPTIDQLTAHALGEGTPDERAAIEAHLAADPVARAEVAAIRETARLLSDGLAAEKAPGLDADRRQALSALDTPKRVRFPAWIGVVATGALAAGVAVAVMPTVSVTPTAGDDAAASVSESLAAASQPLRVKQEAAAQGFAGPAAPSAAAEMAAVAEDKADQRELAKKAKEQDSLADVAMHRRDERPTSSLDTPAEVGDAVASKPVVVAAAPTAPAPAPAPASAAPAPVTAPSATAARFSAVGAGGASAADYKSVSPAAKQAKDARGDSFAPREAEAVAPGEGYPGFDAGGWHRVTSAPDDANRLSTFGADVDTASYANVRRFLRSGQLPPVDAVRAEELVNAFRYAYTPPRERSTPFAVHPQVADCPWDVGHRLVRIGLKGYELDKASRPPANLVFLVDVSGSMGEPTKLPLVQRALGLLTQQLRNDDRVAIVTYANGSGVRLESTTGEDKSVITAAVDGLSAGGGTNGAGGITLAYEVAKRGFIRGGVNRVVLCTDGDFNVGVSSRADLERLITEQAKSGVFLTALGFGMGNYQDTTLQVLADKGNGAYAYIDSEAEARRQLVDGCTGMLVTIAKDVKFQVEFNPATVAAWRLIGYEKRALAHQDFLDDRKDAGEIGAGHTVTALYEVEPLGAAALPALRYEAEPALPAKAGLRRAGGELLTVSLRWKLPDGAVSTGMAVPVADATGPGDADTRFAGAVAEFAQGLRGLPGSWDLERVLRTAQATAGADPQRLEFVDLVRQAQQLRR